MRIVSKKPDGIVYRGRTYMPGEMLDASSMDAKTLVTIGFAENAPATGSYNRRDMVAKPATAPSVDAALAAAREDYQRVVGKRPYYGWDVVTLRTKMAEAQAEAVLNGKE